MVKLLEALTSIFAKPIATAILPQLIKAENTKQPGPEKKTIAVRTITVIIKEQPETFNVQGMNPSVPWAILLPVLIDAMVKVLNIFFGKKWVEAPTPVHLLDVPPTQQEPGPAPNPRS